MHDMRSYTQWKMFDTTEKPVFIYTYIFWLDSYNNAAIIPIPYTVDNQLSVLECLNFLFQQETLVYGQQFLPETGVAWCKEEHSKMSHFLVYYCNIKRKERKKR